MFKKYLLAPTLTALVAGTSLTAAAPIATAADGITAHRLDPDRAASIFGREMTGPFPTRTPVIGEDVLKTMAPRASAVGTPGTSAEGNAEATTEAYGQAKLPYTTARVAVKKPGFAKNKAQMPVTSFPFSATGKLYVRFGSKTFVCTASLIRRGILVTAAHCVSNFGENEFADAAIWYPSQYLARKKGRPYGGFTAINIFVPTPYLDGTDTCSASSPGVVCNNDIATVALKKRKINWRNVKGKKKKKRTYPGVVVGSYDYGYNGYSFVQTPSDLGKAVAAQITQLGYPVAFDKGNQMQRTDALGFSYEDGDLKTTVIGSAQTGGSSGGPWIVNLGAKSRLDGKSASRGSQYAYNVVVGVTSYGVESPKNVNYQGASFFGQNTEFPKADYSGWGAGNIGALLKVTCQEERKSC